MNIKVPRSSMNNNSVAVVLAGGSGLRLWPLSRQSCPKQFLRLLGDESLLQTTVKRLVPLFGDNIYFVVGESHARLTISQLNEINYPPEDRVITEPVGRNTAAAVYLASRIISEINSDSVIYVFPSDHFIEGDAEFGSAINEALQLTDDFIVTFGITPESPDTGYGYIEAGDRVTKNGLLIRRFTEKPGYELAKKYLNSGRYYWNSGIFAFRMDVLTREFTKYCPEIPELIDKYLVAGESEKPSVYAKLPKRSFDHAIMERTKSGVIIPADLGWSDMGSWKSLYQFSPGDGNGNVFKANVKDHNSSGCYVISDKRLILLNGVSDLVIVDTGDFMLVSDIEKSEEIKDQGINTEDRNYGVHDRYTRYHPWGMRIIMESAKEYTIEKLIINAGWRVGFSELSTGSESLTVLKGECLLIHGGTQRTMSRKESITFYSDDETVIENRGLTDIEILRVSSG